MWTHPSLAHMQSCTSPSTQAQCALRSRERCDFKSPLLYSLEQKVMVWAEVISALGYHPARTHKHTQKKSSQTRKMFFLIHTPMKYIKLILPRQSNLGTHLHTNNMSNIFTMYSTLHFWAFTMSSHHVTKWLRNVCTCASLTLNWCISSAKGHIWILSQIPNYLKDLFF